MMRIRMIVADSDALYLSSLCDYFMEKAPQLELNAFTQNERLLEALRAGEHADILAVEEAMASPQLSALAGKATRIALCEGDNAVEGFETVRKYQKSEKLLSEILLRHAEAQGSAEVIVGKSRTRIAAFYSPAGGTGKTTLSLAAAAAAAGLGFRTLYLNLEEVDSLQGVLEKTPASLSEVYLALKTKGMNAGVRLAAGIGQAAPDSFCYISGPESISEYEEIDSAEIGRLLEAVRTLADYDLVFLDLSSGFGKKTQKALEQSDVIFIPLVPEYGAVMKLRRLLSENKLHDMYDPLFRKMQLIVNKAGAQQKTDLLRESGLLDELPCCMTAAYTETFASYQAVIGAGNALAPVMGPVVQAARGQN